MSNFFLNIVNMSISASWIVLAVLILRLLLKKAPKWINSVLWGIVGIRLIMPFSLESIFSLIPSTETISKAPDAPRPHFESGVTVIDNQVNDYIYSHYFEGVTRPTGHFVDITTILAIVWVVGISALLIYTIISYLRLKNKIGTAVLLHDNIFQSENIVSPFVLGIIKPKIYLPFNMDGQAIKHVIAHEQAHINRKDYLWKPLGFLLLTLHWFNPLMWLGYVLLCRDIELACDEKVVKEFTNEQKADYSQALLSCSVNRRMIAACPLAFGEAGVKNRVKSVLNYKKPAFWVVMVAIITSVAVAVCFLTNPKREIGLGIDGIGTHTFKPIELVYDDGMYSFVQTVDNAPTYLIANNMQLLEKIDSNVSEPLGTFGEITLNKNSFDSRFRTNSDYSWLANDTLKSLKDNNKRIWQLYGDASAETPNLYILLEQKDGIFYLGYGYYNFNSVNPTNPDDSHIRWLYKLNETVGDDEENVSSELEKPNGDEIIKEMPILVVISNEQSIEAMKGSSTWTYQLEDGRAATINSDGMHPLHAKEHMSSIDLLPSIFSHTDGLSARLQFNADGVTPIYEIPPDEVYVRCWNEKQWGETNAKSEDIAVHTNNGNLFFPLKDGSYIYEVVATWSSSKNYNGTVSYSFYTKKSDMKDVPVTHYPANIGLYEVTPANQIQSKYDNEEFVITKLHYQTHDGLWVADGNTYKYRLEITGRLNNAAKNTTYIILSNSQDITFEQAWKASGLSSLSTDYFDPADAVIVGNKIF